MKLNVCVVLGTRPEFMKMSPIINELENRKIKHFVIHTGQHYSFVLDRIFFKNLQLKNPDYNLNVGPKSPGHQTGTIISKMDKILQKRKPTIVLVPGDTHTTLAGAIAARKLDILVGHVESGLRSYDELMPEEWNRRMVDHCSDFLFAPTKVARDVLVGEGIPNSRIFVTGNTIVDAVKQNFKHVINSNILEKFRLTANNYILTSIHRKENVTNYWRFKNLIEGLKLVNEKIGIPIIFPIHPRTKKIGDKLKINFGRIKLVNPVGYFDFLKLETNARVVLTDSGGVQEETCILRIPCVTLRYNTERPESVHVGANIIAGTEPQRILKCTKEMIRRKRSWSNPFGDGKAAKKIIDIISKKI